MANGSPLIQGCRRDRGVKLRAQGRSTRGDRLIGDGHLSPRKASRIPPSNPEQDCSRFPAILPGLHRFSPLGGKAALSAFLSSSSLCNPPFPMNSLVPVAHPHPFSQSYVSLVVAILYFFALFALLSNPDSEFSFFSQPTTRTQSYTRNPTHAIPHAAIPPAGNPTRRQS